jgi:protein SCO1/2
VRALGRTAIGLLLAAVAGHLRAEPSPAPIDPGRDIGFDQKLGNTVDLDLPFVDESGHGVRLRDYMKGRPVVLSLAYYRCPMLCQLGLQGLASSLKPLAFGPGREFEVVTVSFDPRETPELAQTARASSLLTYGRPEGRTGWHFLTGGEEAIRKLTDAVGFRYAWDEESGQYAHATGIVILTPEGRVSRYLFGIDYAPKDLRLALIESAGGRIGTLTDRLLLLCYRYDPHTGRYSALAMTAVRAGAILSVLGIGSFVILSVRRERRRGSTPPGSAAS